MFPSSALYYKLIRPSRHNTDHPAQMNCIMDTPLVATVASVISEALHWSLSVVLRVPQTDGRNPTPVITLSFVHAYGSITDWTLKPKHVGTNRRTRDLP